MYVYIYICIHCTHDYVHICCIYNIKNLTIQGHITAILMKLQLIQQGINDNGCRWEYNLPCQKLWISYQRGVFIHRKAPVFNHGYSPKSISITNKYRTDCLPYIDRFIHHLLTYHVYWRAGSSQIYSPSNRIHHPKIYYFMGFQPTIHMAGS